MIKYDVFLLLSRDNNYSKDSLKCLDKCQINTHIKLHVSTTKSIFKNLRNLINLEKVQVILNEKKFKTLFDHMIFLTEYSNSEYITFIHDDDLFDKNYFLKSYSLLSKHLPIALSNRTHFIDKFSNKHKRRIKKPKNDLIKLNKYIVLSRYFLPFDRPVDTPTIIYDRREMLSYWRTYNSRNLSLFEDARIAYHFSKKGIFLEYQDSSIYSWRICDYNLSNQRKEIDRLRLMAWLKNLPINSISKFVFLIGAKLQYFVFYKKNFGNLRINKILYRLRDEIIKFRSGL